ncbi:hypothetical protein [Bradyrhizobium sp. USDA 10063]
MFRFETANFIVSATIRPDHDVDISFDETDETASKLESGEWQAFTTTITVMIGSGIELGSDTLCGSIYADPAEFFSSHRDPNPMNRNCSIMRAAQGDKRVICHYFPDMVREAIRNARKTLHNLPKVRAA